MFVRTERLLLRPGWPEDAHALASAISDEAIVRNLAHVPWPYDLADARCFLHSDRAAGECALLVFRRTKAAPRLIGSVGLARAGDGALELGYWISRPHWGLGYATEAAAGLIQAARHSLRLKCLRAQHFLDNPASGRVLAKLGFRSTGMVTPRFSAGRGCRCPSKSYALTLADKCGDVDNEAAQALMRAQIAA